MALAQLQATPSALSSTQCFRSRQVRAPKAVARCSRISAEAQQGAAQTSRREALASLSATAALLAASPAHAALFGGPSKEETYKEETGAVLKQVEDLLALEKGDPAREEKVKDVRSATNKWVAKYRRDGAFQGKSSFGNTYTVLNALAGHFNSFGNNAPLPKKRLDRIVKEVADAERQLARGR